MARCNRSAVLARMLSGWSPSISLAFVGVRQPAHTRGWGGVDLCRPKVRWPRHLGHHGVVQQVCCTRADALGMVSIDLSGICGWSPTRTCTRLGREGLVSPKSSMATPFGTPRRGATGPLHSRGCSRHGHHRSLWHLQVVATRAHTRLGRGGIVSPKSSMGSHFGTPWRGAAGPLHSRGCPGAGHHRSLWHFLVVANPRTHAVGAGWTCVAQ